MTEEELFFLIDFYHPVKWSPTKVAGRYRPLEQLVPGHRDKETQPALFHFIYNLILKEVEF